LYLPGGGYIPVATLNKAAAIMAVVILMVVSRLPGPETVSEAYAQPPAVTGPGSRDSDRPDVKEGGDTVIDRYHRDLSEDILRIADWLDSFFDNDRTVAEENRTRLRIKFHSLMEEGQGPVFDTRTSFRLFLPRTQKRLNLLISGEPEDSLSPENTPTEDRREEFENTDEQNLIVSLQYKLKETLRRNISTNAGIRFSRTTPVFYTEGRYRHQIDLRAWILRFTQSLKWFADEGLESRTRIDVERPAAGGFFFRTTADGSW